LPGGAGAPDWQIVVAGLEWSGPRPGAGSPDVLRSVLEEVLATPGAAGAPVADRIAVAHTGDEAVALVPLEPGPAPRGAAEEARGAAGSTPAVDGSATATGTARDAGEAGELAAPGAPQGDAGANTARGRGLFADEVAEAVRGPLGAALDGDGRLTLGVSAVVHSAEGLRGALEEARHARRVAAARRGRVCAAGHHELASHVLLLPFVPDDVRRAFTARLLDPLREYDERHRAELVPTLEAFLDCDGSWTRCASRLHLHVNTLRYRIGRIEQLTGRELARLEDKLDFYLALRMS
ncbi:PucR family transcriptional regulator, partial [Streptomyces fuscigenes]|uniref:PucR family transcriptional regulator n=1 Tax=Streptomyces fuscigenes TaxID=1528880 RepID=UPI001F482C9A